MKKKILYADEQLIETILEDYLKRNPRLKREDITIETVGGKMVIQSIRNAMRSASKESQTSPEYRKLVNEIGRGSQERHAACEESIHCSKTYIGWMMLPRYTGDEQEKFDSYLNDLDVLEQESSRFAEDLKGIKDQFSESINGGIKPSPSLIQTLVHDYLTCVLSQLKCERSLFRLELELGDKFINNVKRFLTHRIPAESDSTDSSFLQSLAKAIVIIKENAIEIPESVNLDNMKQLDAGLNELRDQLQIRRQKLLELDQLIAFIEVIIEQTVTPSPKPTDQEIINPKTNSFKRMAFHKKKR